MDTAGLKKKINQKYDAVFAGLILVLILAGILALCLGRYWIPFPDVVKVLLSRVFPVSGSWDANTESVVMTLRLPRVAAAVLVGGSLALSGAVYQGVFQNPLVAPDLLGVSSGACIGAALAILFSVGTFGVQVGAFIGGIIAVMITTAIPRVIKNNSNMMLVLAGIIVTGLMNSIMGIIKYIADPETQLAEITYWQMGSIAKVLPNSLLMIIKTTRMIVIVCATLLTACSVCICGTIGWVGLVVPHLGRLLVGPDNMKLLPVSFVVGGIFLLVVDTIARTLTSAELPLSILTGLIGAPFYFYLLKKQRMNLS